MTQAMQRDPIPENFDSVEAAIEFWDTHSVADYWDLMEDVNIRFDIKGHILMATTQVRDPIPESFASYEEAGEFWDTHSTDDYEDLVKEIEVEFDLKQRRFFVEIREELFLRARALAKSRQQSLEDMLHQLLESELAKVAAL